MPFEKVGVRTGADEDDHIAFYSVDEQEVTVHMQVAMVLPGAGERMILPF